MADLNRALTHIVANLSELLSKINQDKEDKITKPKKNPNTTYHQFLSEVLAGRQPPSPINKKAPYQLYEDLQLLIQLTSVDHISIKAFQEIANKKILHRSAESMQSRYSQCLHNIEEKDVRKIVSWIEEEGLKGYLLFQNGELSIQRNQPVSHQKRNRPVSLQKQAQSQQRKQKLLKTSKIPNNCKQLHETLKLYSKMVNIPQKTLLDKLDQVSGDLAQLSKYIETKDARLLWSASEDEILIKQSPQIDVLRRYRGNAAIQNRKKYLGIS